MLKEILENQIMVCQACQATNRFPITVTDGMLPVELVCPKCTNRHLMERMPTVLPKVVPSQTISFWNVMGKEHFDADAEQETDSTSQEQTPAANVISFQNRARQISAHLINGMKLISNLRADIDNFEHAMYAHMSEEKRIAAAFGRWDGQALKAFTINPISVVQVGCDDDLMQKYTRLIVSPAFYQPRCGFMLSDPGIGGLIVELMNPYSRLNFPITDALAEQIGVPPNLDLIVTGSKIHGSTLPHCYKDIPGTIEDGDHTKEHPSISVHPSPEYGYLARQWLAQHAVVPWSKRYLRDDMIRFNEPLGEVMKDEGAKHIWKRFKSSGRTAVFSSNIIDARRMVAKVIAAIKGLKLIIYGNEDERATWGTLYPQNAARDIAYMGPEDHFTLNAIKEVYTIVVDNVHQVEVERLIQLYGYTGYLIVICSDPLLDFATDNDNAAIVHSLVNCSCFDLEVKKPRSKWGSPLNAALRKLQGLKPLKKLDRKRTKLERMYDSVEYFI